MLLMKALTTAKCSFHFIVAEAYARRADVAE